jgi:hypothetical protein
MRGSGRSLEKDRRGRNSRGGKLVAEALAASGGQDDQAVFSGKSRLDRLLL